MSWLTTDEIEDTRLYIVRWHKLWPKPLGELPAEHATTLAVLSDWLDDKRIDAAPLRSFNRQPRTELVDSVLNLLERAERELQKPTEQKSPPESVPTGEPPPEAADGVFGIDGFRYQGREYRGLTPRATKLLNCAWTKQDHTCKYDDAIAAVHRDEHADALPEDPLGGARKDANKFFRDNEIALAVKVSGDMRVGRVTVALSASEKTRPKTKKRSKMPARRP